MDESHQCHQSLYLLYLFSLWFYILLIDFNSFNMLIAIYFGVLLLRSEPNYNCEIVWYLHFSTLHWDGLAQKILDPSATIKKHLMKRGFLRAGYAGYVASLFITIYPIFSHTCWSRAAYLLTVVFVCLFACCLLTDFFCKKLTPGGSQNWFQILTLDGSLRCDTMLASILVIAYQEGFPGNQKFECSTRNEPKILWI